MQALASTLLFIMFPFSLILVSYTRSIKTILMMPSATGHHCGITFLWNSQLNLPTGQIQPVSWEQEASVIVLHCHHTYVKPHHLQPKEQWNEGGSQEDDHSKSLAEVRCALNSIVVKFF